MSIFCGTDVDTIVLSSNVRLSCMLPAPWISGQTLQGTWMSLMSRGCRSSFRQENSTFYGDDISYYFPQYVVESSGCVNISKPSEAIVDQFHVSTIASSSTIPAFLDLNIKWDLSNTLPQWPQWMEEDPVEMLFNRTEMGVPIFQLKKTSERLRNRCEWVLATFSLLDHMTDRRLRFWESVSATIRQ